MNKKVVLSGLLLTLTMVNLTAYAGEQYLQQRNQEQIQKERAFKENYAKRYNNDGYSKSLMDTVNGTSGKTVDENGNFVFDANPPEETVREFQNMRWKQW